MEITKLNDETLEIKTERIRKISKEMLEDDLLMFQDEKKEIERRIKETQDLLDFFK